MYAEFFSKLVITKIYSASTIYSNSEKKIKRVNRPNWAIVIKYEGETLYTTIDKQFISNNKNIAILPKGSNYEAQFIKSGHCSIIEFECDLKHDSIFHFPLTNSNKILELFKKIEYKKAIKDPLCEIECMQYIYTIINKLLTETSNIYTPNTKQKKLLPALEYISQNYTKKITNDDLASLTDFSTDYFRKLFFRIYGVSPIEYVHSIRIKKAKEMLKSDYISISDIAFSLGYTNIYDFSRSFKNATGIAPSKYANNSYSKKSQQK